LLTLTQLLQKIRSFAEHSGGPGVTPGWQDWSYSWRTGFLGRLTIWPYNINFHREHHEWPALHWHALPAAAAAAAGAANGITSETNTVGTARALSSRSLWRVLCELSVGAAEAPRSHA
jgi:fatty acid desaturase